MLTQQVICSSMQICGVRVGLLTLGAHAHEGYSSLFVCLSVCLSVTTSLAHLEAKTLQFGHE